MNITPKPLTAKSFAPFGDVLEAVGASDMTINQGMCERFNDRAKLDFAPGGQAGISIFHGKTRALPHSIDMVERHPDGSQAFIPMSQDPFLVVVAPNEGWQTRHAAGLCHRPRTGREPTPGRLARGVMPAWPLWYFCRG